MKLHAMWYVAFLLFAEKAKRGRRRYRCESCQVLFCASSALNCYERAIAWAKAHEEEGAFRFVGVEHIKSLEDGQPGDGSEIGGRFYETLDIWRRIKSFIPKLEEIPIIKWETHPNEPVADMMTPKQKRVVRRFLRK